ncbi:hypothetical protein DS909_09765 [Phaeobacter gallaeciensis]|uniref:ABC transmembrane type-1 domain-containing protein n=2 Tax=Roseobacteraceae TaxID=2854170 RepID=A0A366X112_9RHOB|nr:MULTISPECIES: ATP-binding cassette domain-containing protein [Roseobacteraceae]MBT3140006.1 ATP-binding cassette domain-containing protein [Falsiruegeria litorea]MBT8169461.1 ATP-binding cassette domain-containing protein [Falsiruegeria litorea]RBW55909.1 hypothetical protein DS909_09765 [Phaeobacter gallaeciensis]
MSNSKAISRAAETSGGFDVNSFVADVLSTLGNSRQASEILSAHRGKLHAENAEDIAFLFNVCGAAAFTTKGVPDAWNDGVDCAVVAISDGQWHAIVRHGDRETVFPEGARVSSESILQAETKICVLDESEADAAEQMYAVFIQRRNRFFRELCWQSLAINLCALSVPFFTMAVYSRVLGAGAQGSLMPLLTGAIIVLSLMFLMRRTRAGLIAAERPRLAATLSMMTALKILRRQPLANAALTAPRAVSQIRTAERAADLFASQNVTAIFDAPFIALSLIAILFVGGWMVIIPAVYLVLFLGFGYAFGSIRPNTSPNQSRLSAERQHLMEELVQDEGEIVSRNRTEKWMKRLDQVSRQVTRDGLVAQSRSGAMQAIGFVLGTGTALVTLIIGLDLVLTGHLQAGVLIGMMLLTWRVTGPAQALFLGFPRIQSIRTAWAQLHQILKTPTIAARAHKQTPFPEQPTSIKASGLYFRFPGAVTPALSGVSFDIPDGSSVIVMGPNGSGKTTLLKMLAGRLNTQSGMLLMNGCSIDQYDPDSMAQFVQFSADETSIDQDGRLEIPADKSLYLLDNPDGLGSERERHAIRNLMSDDTRQATLIVSTHDTSLAEVADLAIVLDKGGLAYFGPVAKPDDNSIETIKTETIQ